jgi:hypothetical protein
MIGALGLYHGQLDLIMRRELGEILRDVTGIDLDVIEHRRSRTTITVAEKMSWAAGRQTSRREDIAYCLLGLFEVNMPLLYGEGDRAFFRLQKEIIQDKNDQSIFAWGAGGLHDSMSGDGWQLFARRPDNFKSWGLYFKPFKPVRGLHYSMTNSGLEIQLRMARLLSAPGWYFPPTTIKLALGLLDVYKEYGRDKEERIAVPLVMLPMSGDHARALRCLGSTPFSFPSAFERRLMKAKTTLIYLEEGRFPVRHFDANIKICWGTSGKWKVADYFPPSVLVESSPSPVYGHTIRTYGNIKTVLTRYYHSTHDSLLLLLTQKQPEPEIDRS